MTKLPSRYLLEEVRRRWLARPPLQRHRAQVQAFGQALLSEGMRLGANPAMHQEFVKMIVRPLVEPG
jgi:hypothetical protein